MTVQTKHPIAATAAPPPATAPASTSFDDQLARALGDCARGRPAALLHLDTARACDIALSCGEVGSQALHDCIVKALPARRSGSRSDPILTDELCGFTVLLRDCAAHDAVHAAKRLRSAVDSLLFHWHGHPFRLGVHVGVVELGPAPVALRPWLDAAREAATAARELGGTGVQLVRYADRAWRDIAHEREWHEHLREIIA